MYGENTNTMAIPIYRVLPYPVIHVHVHCTHTIYIYIYICHVVNIYFKLCRRHKLDDYELVTVLCCSMQANVHTNYDYFVLSFIKHNQIETIASVSS